ncbi:hypothetical protein CYMTET_29195 [Cymbomonas tetramitiformis]|uniref:Uncharacterized protein n=1 Tax=Cymbomonas tetramitiformis TaxID=36881 RepID=A0AAE0FLB9_9CHLO|nr:hypothetical protein CYMTET_29195 [Cymbomonas tetramitiformis]
MWTVARQWRTEGSEMQLSLAAAEQSLHEGRGAAAQKGGAQLTQLDKDSLMKETLGEQFLKCEHKARERNRKRRDKPLQYLPVRGGSYLRFFKKNRKQIPTSVLAAIRTANAADQALYTSAAKLFDQRIAEMSNKLERMPLWTPPPVSGQSKPPPGDPPPPPPLPIKNPPRPEGRPPWEEQYSQASRQIPQQRSALEAGVAAAAAAAVEVPPSRSSGPPGGADEPPPSMDENAAQQAQKGEPARTSSFTREMEGAEPKPKKQGTPGISKEEELKFQQNADEVRKMHERRRNQQRAARMKRSQPHHSRAAPSQDSELEEDVVPTGDVNLAPAGPKRKQKEDIFVHHDEL